MPNPSIIAALAGVSSVIGFILVIAYFYLVLQVKTTERSLRHIVEGEGLFNADQIVRILSTFTDDGKRLEALERLTQLDRAKAQQLLRKVRENIDVTHIQALSHQSRQIIAVRTGAFLLLIGIVGVVGSRYIPIANNSATPTVQSGRIDRSILQLQQRIKGNMAELRKNEDLQEEVRSKIRKLEGLVPNDPDAPKAIQNQKENLAKLVAEKQQLLKEIEHMTAQIRKLKAGGAAD